MCVISREHMSISWKNSLSAFPLSPMREMLLVWHLLVLLIPTAEELRKDGSLRNPIRNVVKAVLVFKAETAFTLVVILSQQMVNSASMANPFTDFHGTE